VPDPRLRSCRQPHQSARKGPRLDFQDHLADLEAAGLVTRIDTPINKDTELHPLVRLQFIGGIPESKRRAFLFTNVIDASGRRYDIPVVVGGIIPPADAEALRAEGVAAVFTPKDFEITAIISGIIDVIRRAHKLQPWPGRPGALAGATSEG